MDSLKFNKIAASLLLAALTALSGIQLAKILSPQHNLTSNAYRVEIVDTSSAVASSAPKGPEPILAMLASADVAAGQKLSKKCAACHVFDAGGKNKVGPSLWSIVNANKGAHASFAYSSALTDFGGAWDYASLNAFLYKPKTYIKGTKMTFIGLKKPRDRANMIAYLRSLSDSPVPLPTEADIANEAIADEAVAEEATSGTGH